MWLRDMATQSILGDYSLKDPMEVADELLYQELSKKMTYLKKLDTEIGKYNSHVDGRLKEKKEKREKAEEARK